MRAAADIMLGAAACLLLLSGLVHVRDWRALLAILIAHRVLPYRASRVTARLLGPTELAMGVTAILITASEVSDPKGPARAVVASLVASLFLLMTVYLVAARRRSGAAPCACFGWNEPLTALTIARTAVLAAGAVVGAFDDSPIASQSLATIAVLSVVVAGILVAVPHLYGRHLRAGEEGPSRDHRN